MSLTKYRQNRHFEDTPEPRGKAKASRGALRFVVQTHQASRLHYDFRLELGGTLKSWAVPKGPSLNPEDKRLAMMVEDHPLEYRSFEGIIPDGNYGAGTVMVWDQGTYTPAQPVDRKESERLLQEGLETGHLRFLLHGRKLKGEFALIKMRKGQPNAWLLIKKRDQYATAADVRERDRSVVSRRGLDAIARHSRGAGQVWHSSDPSKDLAPPEAKKSRMPRKVKPMLATLVDQPFDRAGWLFELKWDGYRAIAEVNAGQVRLYSRNHKSFTERYAPVVQSLQRLGHQAVLDGEIVVVDSDGLPSFQLLQNYQRTGAGLLV
jgi:bifunctional non-homologous end joining protein LigD